KKMNRKTKKIRTAITATIRMIVFELRFGVPPPPPPPPPPPFAWANRARFIIQFTGRSFRYEPRARMARYLIFDEPPGLSRRVGHFPHPHQPQPSLTRRA